MWGPSSSFINNWWRTVIFEGEIVGIVPREAASEEKIGLMMTGGLRLNRPEKEAAGQ